MIVNSTYFEQGELLIPNARDIDAVKVGGLNKPKLDNFIDKYERELLMDALGVTLYDELVVILKANTLEDAGKEHWKILVDGGNYDVDDKTVRFDGLRGFNKQSLVASYVFCRYLRNNDVTYTTVGTVRDTAKNATSVTATPKYVNVWNGFIKKYQGSHDGMLADTPRIIRNPAGLVGLSFFNSEGVQRSLYQYLFDINDSDNTKFTDFEFKFRKLKNSMGI